MPASRAINTVDHFVVRVVLKLIILVCVLTDVLPTIKSCIKGEVSNALVFMSSSAVTVNTNDSDTTTGFLSTVAVTLTKANPVLVSNKAYKPINVTIIHTTFS